MTDGHLALTIQHGDVIEIGETRLRFYEGHGRNQWKVAIAAPREVKVRRLGNYPDESVRLKEIEG